MSALSDAAVERAYGVGWSVVRHMPEASAYALFDGVADASWARRGRSVQRLESNLRRVTGDDDVRALSKDAMRRYLRYWCDAFRLPGWSRERIVDTLRCEGEQVLVDGLAAGRGVVIALPHMGNWDHAGAWASVAHSTVVSVAERLKPEQLYEQFLDFRRALGMEIIPLTGGDPPFRTLLRRLRSGSLVALLGDRDLTDAGLPVRFFDGTAKFPAGPAALAVHTGAELLAATLWYDHGFNYVRLEPVDVTGGDIATITQRVADVFAAGIEKRPADWHMLSRVWVDEP